MHITVRPRRVRVACAVAASFVVVAFAVVAILLRQSVRGVHVGFSDQVAVFAIGLLAAAGIMLIARPRLEADEQGLRVRNYGGERTVPWTAVRAVEFRDGSPWASLALADDDSMALMAVQSIDGEHTVEAISALRALHAASQPDH